MITNEPCNYNIGIDLDDTIEDLVAGWLSWLNGHYGTAYKPEDITEWDIASYFPTLSRDEVFAPLHNSLFWEKYVKMKPDAAKYIKMLFDEGFNIYIVTSATPESLLYKWEYIISEHLPFLTHKNIIMCSNKQLLSNLDILIDDGIHNLVGGKYTKILLDAPHNRQSEEIDRQYGLNRLHDWKEIYETVMYWINEDMLDIYW